MFLDTLQDTNPTRYRQGVNPHVFDLMLTDKERMADQLRGKSDHIYICIAFILNCYTLRKAIS